MNNKLIAVFVAAALTQAAVAQSGADSSAGADALEQVVVTGTRVANRSALDTPVPVDVIPAEALQNLGVTEINQALSVALPSFNFPRPGLTDGTDTVRPATLRGLAPDQTLVLVNGKRRHSAALVNVNGTVGRGAASADLNTIPNNAISAIEVLRDGASAQYGSDAIAGVINLRLREARDGGEGTVSYGWRETEYETATGTPPTGANWSAPRVLQRSRSDGETLTISGWKGFSLGDTGFLTVSAEVKEAERTERGGWDFRQQYAKTATGAFDPREATFQRFSAWYGEPELSQKTVFLNSGAELSEGVDIYASASWQDRSATSAGFYRPASDARNVVQIYPDGFLPLISPDVTDFSAAVGLRWAFAGWDMDTSVVYGKNKMAFTIENTLNRSLGTASKTSFDAGGFDYDQGVLNISGVRGIEVAGLASPLNVALGLEARREGYGIFAGEPDSYRNGGVQLNGAPTASGAQVFPGFRPGNVVNEHRSAVGAYLDLEANLTENFLGSAAIRVEEYSDFGNNVSGKISGRYDFSDAFALRASVSSGFRAPSLQQQYFATTSTNFINGIPFDITTFPVSDPVAVALGAKPLEAEESMNFSVGAVIRTGDLSLTIDAYRINIDNRIVLSENLTATNVRDFLTSKGFIGIGGGRFFINGVDTNTRGVDVVANYPVRFDNGSKIDVTATANFNSTEVTRLPTISQIAQLNPTLFGRVNVLTFEEGNPKNKFGLSGAWSHGPWGATLRATRYGDVLSPGTTAATDFVLKAKTLVDLEARYEVNESVKVALGADNILDKYPDGLPPSLNTTGATAFSNYSPFGRSGRFIYGRVTVGF
ncbi:MAG: TonB-dependent receptor [Gammaproteobacteria bacterium]|nr:TonB-dependent receptor [Gammaproteobacteria bacterium]